MGCYCNGKYHYTNMISALATGQISYKDAMCEILKRLCELENGEYSQVQSDWTETETNNPAYIKNKPSVSDFQADWNNSDTNSYGYIKNKPTIPSEQIQADWTETNVSSKAFIKNKPAIPSAQVQSDWDETDETEPSFIQNKPGTTTANNPNPTLVPPTPAINYYVLHANGEWHVMYSNAINWKPGIDKGQVPAFQSVIDKYQNQADWTETDTDSPAFIKNKPSLPSAQVQSNWMETDASNVSFIKNKPVVMDGGVNSKPQLVPGFSSVDVGKMLKQNGVWDYARASAISWDGINNSNFAAFQTDVQKAQLHPTFGGSRGVNAFAMSVDPRDDINDWSIIQHWPYVCGWEKIDGVYYKFHFTSYINDYTCTIPSPTNPFYNFGFVADYIFSGSGLSWSVYKSAYDNGRTYSSVKYFTPYKDSPIDMSDVGLNVTLTNAGGYLGAEPASGSGNVTNALTLGRYFNNSGNESMGFGLWPLQNFKQGSWFECELWVWL